MVKAAPPVSRTFPKVEKATSFEDQWWRVTGADENLSKLIEDEKAIEIIIDFWILMLKILLNMHIYSIYAKKNVIYSKQICT